MKNKTVKRNVKPVLDITKGKTKLIGNSYDRGSWLEQSKAAWQNAGGINIGDTLSSISGGIGGIVSNVAALSHNDTSHEDLALDAIRSQNPYGKNDMDLFSDMLSNQQFARTDYTARDFNASPGEIISGILGSTASGAGAGASIGGPWGALGGAATGLFASTAAAINKGIKANQLYRQYNAQGQQINNNIKANTENAYGIMNRNNLDTDLIAKKEYGGPLNSFSGDFDNGITFVENGGTHEDNPYGGVMVGLDQEGTPNLVEEGEVIWNDYVFSNRLKLKYDKNNPIKIDKRYDGWTFAAIAEDMQNESAERPNDGISKAGMQNSLSKLIALQEEVRMKQNNKTNQFKHGGLKGNLYDGTGNSVNTLYSGLDFDPDMWQGLDEDTLGMLYEDYNREYYRKNPEMDLNLKQTPREGASLPIYSDTFKYYNDGKYDKDYLDFVDKLNYNKDASVLNHLRKYYNKEMGTNYVPGSKAFLDETKRIAKDVKFGEFHKALEKMYDRSRNTPSVPKITPDRILTDSAEVQSPTGLAGIPETTSRPRSRFNIDSFNTAVSDLTQLGSLVYNAANPPKNDDLDMAMQLAAATPGGSYTPVGGKVEFDPVDRNFYLNQLQGAQAGVARAMQNQGLNAGQTLGSLQSLYNQGKQAQALLDMDARNRQDYLQTMEINRNIDLQNENMRQKALADDRARQNLILNTYRNNIGIADQREADYMQAISHPMDILAQNAMDRARQNIAMNMINSNPAFAAALDKSGNIRYKSAKYGGMLTKTKKRKNHGK